MRQFLIIWTGQLVSSIGSSMSRFAIGINAGAGIPLLYVICAVCMLIVGFAGFYIPHLRNVEWTLPDHDA
jgi:hypothetical protein